MNKERNRRIHFIVNINQYEKIIEFCRKNNFTIASFCRIAILNFLNNDNGEKILIKDIKFKKQIIYEFRRFGNNLNQIAYKLNTALINDDISYTDKLDIKSAIEDIEDIKSGIYEISVILDKRL